MGKGFACSENEAASRRYIIQTRPGTDLFTFRSYIRTLPDEGDGIQDVVPKLIEQSYITHRTHDEAAAASSHPFVQYVEEVVEDETPI